MRLLKVWVMTWSVPDRFIMSILHGRCGTVNIHPALDGKGLQDEDSTSITVKPVYLYIYIIIYMLTPSKNPPHLSHTDMYTYIVLKL